MRRYNYARLRKSRAYLAQAQLRNSDPDSSFSRNFKSGAFGTLGELLAQTILEGEAQRNSRSKAADIYWVSQNAYVEVKSVNLDERSSLPHATIEHNRGKSDYYLLMLFRQQKFDRCYLIPSADIENDLSIKTNIIIPTDLSTFKFADRLYALADERGITRCV